MNKHAFLTSNGVKRIVLCLFFAMFIACLVSGCGPSGGDLNGDGQSSGGDSSGGGAGSWDNTPKVLTPEMPGTDMLGQEKDGETVAIDISNRTEGYIVAQYKGNYEKVKLILKKTDDPEARDYNYDLTVGGYDVLPLSGGSGTYGVTVAGNTTGTTYAPIFMDTFEAAFADEFRPYLYPNQYVNFTADSQAVAMARDVTAGATGDFDAVEKIFNYAVENIAYDYDKAEQAKQGLLSGYLPNVDDTLATKKGICFDYAALVTTMLRSQGVPTKLVIGYSGEAYHAWISVHLEGVGWVAAIEFKDEDWVLMDPTFASTGSEFQSLVGDGTNYNAMYYY